MKRLIVIPLTVLFVFSTITPAMAAFTPGPQRQISAEADLTGITSYLEFVGDFTYHDKDTGNTTTAGLTWTYENKWKVADKYVGIGYRANEPGWGIRVYTKNAEDGRWTDPNANEPDKPAGLVSQSNPRLVVPLAWKAFNVEPTYKATVTATTDFTEEYSDPKERTVGTPGTHAAYNELYQASNADNYYGKLCYMKDKDDEKWEDTNGDGIINDGDTIVSDFDMADDKTVDYITFVNYLGFSTCTFNLSGDEIIRAPAASPVYLTFAADLRAATLKDTYDTVIYVQLYTE